MSNPVYRRLILKLSGEILAGEQGFGIENNSISRLVKEVKSIYNLGVGLGIIIGAGNIFRGIKLSAQGMDRVTGDNLGMLGTVMNAIAFQQALSQAGCSATAMSAVNISRIIEPYVRNHALELVNKREIVIIAGGTGNPYFTTDSAAALRAAELKAEVVLKGTKVDGIFDKDPVIHPDAKKYSEISFSKVISDNLRVMDLTAMTLCKENSIPIIVINIHKQGDLKKVVLGEPIGTIVRE
ncbi:MAG: UMP kinase [Candidatus Marinimicrobia bacterium]|nr:UMP kinase [Candidatus Neomarinimicrobiota bacterium]